MLKSWKFWVSILISGAALYLALRNVNFAEFFDALAHTEWIWFVPAGAAFIATLLLRAWRWSVLMGDTPFWITFHANNIGYMLNMILPARIGEIGRAFVIGERTRVSMSRALSSIVVERLIDLITVIIMFAVMAQFIPVPPIFSAAALVLGGITALGVITLALIIWQSAAAERLVVGVVGGRLGRDPAVWVRRLNDLIAGFQIYRSRRAVGLTLLTTIAIWSTAWAVAFLCLRAFTPTARLDASGFVLVVSNLGGAVPSAPGGLGVVQLFAQQSLVIPFKVSESMAVAYAFVWSLSQQLALIVLGLIGLWRVGMSFSQTAGAAARPSEGGQGTSPASAEAVVESA